MTSQRRADLWNAIKNAECCVTSVAVAGKVDLYGSYSFDAFAATCGRRAKENFTLVFCALSRGAFSGLWSPNASVCTCVCVRHHELR